MALALLGWALVAVLALVLLGLALPVDLAVTANTDAPRSVRLRLGFLGGRLSVEPLPPRRTPDTSKRRSRPQKPRGGTAARAGRALRNVPRLIGDLLGTVVLRRLALDARFGLGDPAETGAAHGYMMAALAPLCGRPRVSVTLTPDFSGAVLSGRAEAAFRVVPLALVPPVLRFAWRSFGPGR